MRAVVLPSLLLLATLLCLPPPTLAAPCLDAVVGDQSAQSFIQIVSVPQLNGASGTVTGTATNLRTGVVRVSVWAQTDRYYPQPFLNAPFTCVGGDGAWNSFTHGGKRTIVLLVDDTYVIPAGPSPLPSSIDYHPSTDPGVLAWAEIPASPRISFAGETWWLKNSDPFSTGPGPCVFSPDGQNIFVDGEGLHLKIVKQGNTWTCSEVVLDRSRGYGMYSFRVASALDMLDAREVFSGFVFESLTRELDVECSPSLTGLSNGCQYVVQPFSTPGNRRIFSIPPGPSSHRIYWAADHVWFLSWRGLKSFPPEPQDIIQSFVYSGPDVPPPGGERMRFNLWLTGSSPAGGVGSEVVIQSFTYCPLNSYPLGAPADLPTVKVTATPATVHQGNRVAVGLTAQNPTQSFLADFYLGAVIPGRTLCFITSLSPLGATCFPAGSDPRLFPPLLSNVLVPSGLDVTEAELFAYTFGGGEPVGEYLFFSALTSPRAFAAGQANECDLLLVSPASLTFSP